MSARGKKLRHNSSKKKNLSRYIIISFFFLIIIYLILRIFSGGKVWNGEDKVSLAVQKTNGDVEVVVFDPSSEEITSILIPGSTELDVSRNLGKWKLKSVWKLGETNGGSGKLLVKTISKSLKFPVYLWGEGTALSLKTGRLTDIFRALFYPYKTNLSWNDKIEIVLFSLKVRNVDKTEIDISKTPLLKKVNLTDGSEGFEYSGASLPEVYLIFNDAGFSDKSLRVLIRDAVGNPDVVKNFGETLEIMGAKIAQISKEPQKDVGCAVKSGNRDFNKKMEKIFGCVIENQTDSASPSVEIMLGRKFVEEY